MAWVCLKSDSSMGEESRRMAFMAGDDIDTPPNPDESAPGSIVFTADMSAVYVKTVTVNGGEVDFYQFDVRQNNGVNTSHVDYYYVNIPGRGEGIYNSQKMYEMFGLDES